MPLKFSVLLIIVLFSCNSVAGQDGSDIRYYRSKNIDRTAIGKTVQIDFYRWSYRGKLTEIIDTVFIDVGGQKMRFIERRNDDGYNNWFHEQYLESINQTDEEIIRIEKFSIHGITKRVISAEGFIKFYDKNLVLLRENQQKYEFAMETIAGILIASE